MNGGKNQRFGRNSPTFVKRYDKLSQTRICPEFDSKLGSTRRCDPLARGGDESHLIRMHEAVIRCAEICVARRR